MKHKQLKEQFKPKPKHSRLFLFLSCLFSPRRSLFPLLAFIYVLTLAALGLVLAFILTTLPSSLTLNPLLLVVFILSIPLMIITLSFSYVTLDESIRLEMRKLENGH